MNELRNILLLIMSLVWLCRFWYNHIMYIGGNKEFTDITIIAGITYLVIRDVINKPNLEN
jgi:hypothetical protein